MINRPVNLHFNTQINLKQSKIPFNVVKDTFVNGHYTRIGELYRMNWYVACSDMFP